MSILFAHTEPFHSYGWNDYLLKQESFGMSEDIFHTSPCLAVYFKALYVSDYYQMFHRKVEMPHNKQIWHEQISTQNIAFVSKN